MSLAFENVETGPNRAASSSRSTRNPLVAFKSATNNLVRRAANRVKTRTPELLKKGNRLNTTIRVADLAYSKPLAIWSSVVDGNWFRVGDAVVAGVVTGILLYSDQGMEPPAGKSLFQQWKNSLKDPDQAAYFGMAVALPVAAISYGAMVWYMFHGRFEQWEQLAAGIGGTVFGVYAFRRESRRVNEFRASADQQLQRENTLLRIKRFAEKRVGFVIGLASILSQIHENLDVYQINSHDGRLLFAKTAAAVSLHFAGQAWNEYMWRRSAKLCEAAASAASAPAELPDRDLMPLVPLGPRQESTSLAVAYTADRNPYCPIPPGRLGLTPETMHA